MEGYKKWQVMLTFCFNNTNKVGYRYGALQWCHNTNCFSNHQHFDCCFNSLFRLTKTHHYWLFAKWIHRRLDWCVTKPPFSWILLKGLKTPYLRIYFSHHFKKCVLFINVRCQAILKKIILFDLSILQTDYYLTHAPLVPHICIN